MGNFNIFYIALIIFAIALTVKNIIEMKKIKREQAFVQVYTKVLKQEEGAKDSLLNYIATEQLDYLVQKAKILLIYQLMIENEEPVDVVEQINFEPLFYSKGKYDAKLAEKNSDVFVWLSMLYAKARMLSMFDVIDKLSEKLTKYDENLSNQLEYKLYKGVCSCIQEKNDENSKFLSDLLEGEYEGLVYERKLIGLYKRIAATYLVFLGDTVDEYFENDLHSFAETLVGKCIMKDLEIYDKYPPIEKTEEEQKVEEASQEENVKELEEENKEEPKE